MKKFCLEFLEGISRKWSSVYFICRRRTVLIGNVVFVCINSAQDNFGTLCNTKDWYQF